MESIGRVIETSGEIATVEVRRASACEGCHKNAEGGCAVCGLLGGEKIRTMKTKAGNGIGAKIGDVVRIETPNEKTLLWAAIVFLLPLVCLLYTSPSPRD